MDKRNADNIYTDGKADLFLFFIFLGRMKQLIAVVSFTKLSDRKKSILTFGQATRRAAFRNGKKTKRAVSSVSSLCLFGLSWFLFLLLYGVASSLLQCSPSRSIRDGIIGYNCCTHSSASATPTNERPPV